MAPLTFSSDWLPLGSNKQGLGSTSGDSELEPGRASLARLSKNLDDYAGREGMRREALGAGPRQEEKEGPAPQKSRVGRVVGLYSLPEAGLQAERETQIKQGRASQSLVPEVLHPTGAWPFAREALGIRKVGF